MSILVNASTVSGVNAGRTSGLVATGVVSGFAASSVLANMSSKNAATSLGAVSVGLYSRAAADGDVFSKAASTALPSFLIGLPSGVRVKSAMVAPKLYAPDVLVGLSSTTRLMALVTESA